MIIDTHAHYDDEQFDEDREALFFSLAERGIEAVVNVGASLQGCRSSLLFANRYDRVYASVGVHPDEVGSLTEEHLEELRQAAKDPKVVSIGEIGLDYHWNVESREMQKHWFREQLRLAKKVGLPVNIHSRDAAEDTWNVMKEEHLEEIGGIIHCFSYSWEMAQQYLRAGFFLGIGGVVTFKNAKKLKEVVTKMPMDRIVLETDSPYLAPEPHRGTRNDSGYLYAVAEAIAGLRGMETEEVIRCTRDNALRVYPKLQGDR